MAPGFYISQCDPMYVTQPLLYTPTQSCATYGNNTIRLDQSQYANPSRSNRKEETKKEKIKRIAKEKMFASWKTIDRKTETINILKQICKPRHQMKHIGGRMR